MSKKIPTFFLLIIILFLFTNLSNGNSNTFMDYSVRSGTISDDDLEEPLGEAEKDNEKLLNLSNEVVILLQSKKYNKIYNEYFSEGLKKEITLEKFILLNTGIVKKYGEIKSYKLRQWYFIFTSDTNRKEIDSILQSVKIVHHETAILYYKFTVLPAKKDKLAGYFIELKKNLKKE